MSVPEEFCTVFPQKIHTTRACHTTIEKVAEQKMYTSHIVQLETFNFNARYPLSIVLFSK